MAALFLMPHDLRLPGVPAFAAGGLDARFTPGTILFGGDIMLGRAVERLTDERGDAYPFSGIGSLVGHADAAVANFEAAVPQNHVPTQNGSLRLSAPERAFSALAEQGFDVLSFANNHTYDFGGGALAHARAACLAAGLTCIGDPNAINGFSTAVVTAGTTRVGLLAIHATVRAPDAAALRRSIADLRAASDLVVVFIHWGTEYETTHTAPQEKLAHELIDDGADAVIGHHPHVVEDIEVYEGKPIFYSLGNLIFDQYLGDETETGLMVQMKIGESAIVYTLVPVSSKATPSQPHLLYVEARNAYVAALFARSGGVDPYVEGASLAVPR
jgi:poly-gamma-glutamate synthesis protein (capsule biosynthesis protein)